MRRRTVVRRGGWRRGIGEERHLFSEMDYRCCDPRHAVLVEREVLRWKNKTQISLTQYLFRIKCLVW
jgi:hypothetical protein